MSGDSKPPGTGGGGGDTGSGTRSGTGAGTGTRTGTGTGTVPPALPPVSRLPAQLYAARRRARERWRRLSATVTGALVLLAAALYAVIWHTSLLALTSVGVAGEKTISAQSVAAAADLHDGTPLASIDTGAVAARVERLPQVASASVAVDWPHRVVITVTERRPAALIATGAGYDVVDPTGVVFAASASRIAGLPLIQVTGGAPVRAAVVPGALAALRALAPGLAGRVVAVSASDPYAITLHLSGGALVDWGDGSDPAGKAVDLGALLNLGRATRYDVSAPGAPAMN